MGERLSIKQRFGIKIFLKQHKKHLENIRKNTNDNTEAKYRKKIIKSLEKIQEIILIENDKEKEMTTIELELMPFQELLNIYSGAVKELGKVI